jgi:hypothetical protein
VNQASRRVAGFGGFRVFIFRLVFSTRSAKPTFVMSFVDRVITLRSLRSSNVPPEFTDALIVERFAGAHEYVVATMFGVETKLASHLFEIADYIIRLFLWRATVSLRGALNVYAVLVCAG